MALSKAQILEKLNERLGHKFSAKQTNEILETLLEAIKSTLEGGEDVLISGFGKFCVKQKKERKGRNPATEESMMIPARRVISFRCASKLREKVNNS